MSQSLAPGAGGQHQEATGAAKAEIPRSRWHVREVGHVPCAVPPVTPEAPEKSWLGGGRGPLPLLYRLKSLGKRVKEWL